MITRESLNKLGKARAEQNSSINLNSADRRISELDFMEGFRFAVDLLLPGVEALEKVTVVDINGYDFDKLMGDTKIAIVKFGGFQNAYAISKVFDFRKSAREFLAKLERELEGNKCEEENRTGGRK